MAQGFASAIGSALSAITNLGANWGGGTDAHKTADLMNHQSWLWKQNTQWYNDNILAHAYKRARESLEEAGYNPLMGIGNPLSDQGPMPNATANSSAKAINFQKLANIQAKNINADTMLKGAQTEQQISSSRLLNQQRETEIHKTKLEELHTEMQKIENKIRKKDANSYDIRLYNELKQTEIKEWEAYLKYLQTNSTIKLNSAKAREAYASAKRKLNEPYPTYEHGFGGHTGIGPVTVKWNTYSKW